MIYQLTRPSILLENTWFAGTRRCHKASAFSPRLGASALLPSSRRSITQAREERVLLHSTNCRPSSSAQSTWGIFGPEWKQRVLYRGGRLGETHCLLEKNDGTSDATVFGRTLHCARHEWII
ncbi:hypothetical protein MRX96_022849 [Rhipicephalus microplus]